MEDNNKYHNEMSRIESNIACPIVKEDDCDLYVKEPLLKFILIELLEWITIIAVAYGLSVLINTYVIETTEVVGTSMSPTFEPGERLIIDKAIYKYSTPKRGDLVVFLPDSDGKNYVKRIIGLPGETIDFRDGDVYIDDIKLNEDYLDGIDTSNIAGGKKFPYTIGSEEYFAMGDNRDKSYDCRASDIGALTLGRIRGKVFFRIFPLGKMSFYGKINYTFG